MLIMNSKPILTWGITALAALTLSQPLATRANVYPTNVKFNGSKTSLSSPQGRVVNISYTLNEPASAGASVAILSGTNVVRNLTFEAGQNGALRGENIVPWDGKDQAGNLAPQGTYSVRLSAASIGFDGWTMISTDHRTNNYVYRGTGIAVNQNPASPFYGRVYVANSDSGPNAGLPGAKPGEYNGVLQFNADGAPAEEGPLAVSTGFSGFGESPWKIEFGPDGKVYVNDLFYGGEVARWDDDFDPASRLDVLRSSNLPYANAKLSGLALAGTNTNARLYTSDIADPSQGILLYAFDNGQVPAGFVGQVVVAVTNTGVGLDVAPYDVALDPHGDIYTIQYRPNPADPSPRLLKFSLSGTNAVPLINPAWAIGQGDDTLGRASGVAVDPSGQYVAVASRGINGPEFEWINGGTAIFSTSNGLLVTNLDLGVEISGEVNHQDTDVAWDAVGNVYLIDDYAQLWRTFSPPGPNQAVTLGLYNITITEAVIEQPPQIGGISVDNSTVTIRFAGSAGLSPSAFQVLGAATVHGPYNVIPDATITAGPAPGQYLATLPANGAIAFYRILQGEAQPPGDEPVLTGISVSGNTVNLSFTSAATDTPASFTVLSSATATGQFAPAAGAAVSAGAAAGQFRATAPVNGPMQFYRIAK